MSDVIRINEEVVSNDDFIKILKFGGRFDALLDDVVRDKVAIHAAKRLGIAIAPAAVQERADQLRRVRGLHRAADMNRYLQSMKVTSQEFENYIVDMLYYEGLMTKVLSEAEVDKYYRANSPKFDSMEVSHIVVDSKDTAKEIVAILEDEPERFAELAREHSTADTRSAGGYIGRIMRGALQNEVDSKVFHAKAGDVLGPFPSPDGSCFEIFKVNAKRPASYDDEAKAQIRTVLKEDWVAKWLRENPVQVL